MCGYVCDFVQTTSLCVLYLGVCVCVCVCVRVCASNHTLCLCLGVRAFFLLATTLCVVCVCGCVFLPAFSTCLCVGSCLYEGRYVLGLGGGGLMSVCMCGFWEGVELLSECIVWGFLGGGGLMSECICEVWEGGGGLGSCLSVFGAGGGRHVSMGMQDLHLDNIK